jgi:ABC-type multidrug transport system ATPase subunit
VVSGANGAGKSTLLRLAARLEHPTSGEITGGGRREVAWLGQEPGLYDELTVRENLEFSARFFGRAEEVTTAAATFAIAHKLDERARRLSRGEKQRAALARALLCGPLMLLDEPTAALDAEAADACARTLNDLAGARTLLVATHDAELVKRADHVLHLEGGRLR